MYNSDNEEMTRLLIIMREQYKKLFSTWKGNWADFSAPYMRFGKIMNITTHVFGKNKFMSLNFAERSVLLLEILERTYGPIPDSRLSGIVGSAIKILVGRTPIFTDETDKFIAYCLAIGDLILRSKPYTFTPFSVFDKDLGGTICRDFIQRSALINSEDNVLSKIPVCCGFEFKKNIKREEVTTLEDAIEVKR
jgi:hypothetical protein